MDFVLCSVDSMGYGFYFCYDGQVLEDDTFHSFLKTFGISCGKSLLWRGDRSAWHSEDSHFGLRYLIYELFLVDIVEASWDYLCFNSAYPPQTEVVSQSLGYLLCSLVGRRP